MKRWDEQTKPKNASKKPQATKPALPKLNERSGTQTKSMEMRKTYGAGNFTNIVNSPQQLNLTSCPSSGNSDYFEGESIDFDEVPIYKLLKYYGLQQYARVSKYLLK